MREDWKAQKQIEHSFFFNAKWIAFHICYMSKKHKSFANSIMEWAQNPINMFHLLTLFDVNLGIIILIVSF